MTSRFALLVAAWLLAVPQGALAAGPKLPREICLDWGPSVMLLAVRAAGARLATSDGPIAFYELFGEVVTDAGDSFPVAGSGHLTGETGGIFHFGVSGGNTVDLTFFSQHWEVFYFLNPDPAATGHTQSVSTSNGILEAVSQDVETVDCASHSVPF